MKESHKDLVGVTGEDVELLINSASGNATTDTVLDPAAFYNKLTTTGAGSNGFTFAEDGNLKTGAQRYFKNASGAQDAAITFDSTQVLTLNAGEDAVLLLVDGSWVMLGGTGALV